MRQRRIKNLEEKTASHSAYIVDNPAEAKGRWAELFPAATVEQGISAEGKAESKTESKTEGKAVPEIYLEIGCGKGRFITTRAEQNPDKFYIGVEGAESVVLRALEKAADKGLKNVLFITSYLHGLSEFFERGELAGLYLNFSDPWPKDRHAKRRLTHSSYLESYKEVLLPGSFIEFKTDNDGLFAFSVPEFEDCGLIIAEKTDDLHQSEYVSREFETEYEHKFRTMGHKIHYCKAIVPAAPQSEE